MTFLYQFGLTAPLASLNLSQLVFPCPSLNAESSPARQFCADQRRWIRPEGRASIYRNTSAINSYIGQYPGSTGTRSILRLAGMKNFDISLAKRFFMPFKGHTMQFRAEAFNAFNTVNLFNPSLSLKSPATFGEFQSDIQPRVIQLALRYEFWRFWCSKTGR